MESYLQAPAFGGTIWSWPRRSTQLLPGSGLLTAPVNTDIATSLS